MNQSDNSKGVEKHFPPCRMPLYNLRRCSTCKDRFPVTGPATPIQDAALPVKTRPVSSYRSSHSHSSGLAGMAGKKKFTTMDDEFLDTIEDEVIDGENGVDLLLNLLEEDENGNSTQQSDHEKYTDIIRRKRKNSDVSRDPPCEAPKRPRVEENNDGKFNEMKAKVEEMEKELNRLKKQLREKDSGSEKTNQDAQTVSRLFSRGKRIAHQPKGPVLSPQQHTHVGKTEETADKDYATERFSGLRIKSLLIPQEVISERMKGRRMVKIPQITGMVRDGDIEGDWVTIGTIVSKTHPRDTSKGKKFSVWRLSDLSSQMSTISFFLFDKVFQTHWKIPLGHVIAILNASIQTNKDTNSSTGISCNSNRYSLSLDNPAKIMDLGMSYDFTMCKATAKSGKQCQNFANRQHGGYCDYHVQREYSKVRSTRMNCQGGYGPNAQSLQQKLLGRSEVFYGGQWHKGGGVASGKKGKGGGGGSERLFVPGARKEMKEVEKLLGGAGVSGGEFKHLKDGTSVQKGNEIFKELMKGQTPGARCLNSHLRKGNAKASSIHEKEKTALALLQEHSIKKSQSKSSCKKSQDPSFKGPSLSKPEEFELFTPDNLIKTEKPLSVVATPTTKNPSVLPSVKKITSHLTKPPVIRSVKTDEHKERALAVLAKKGPLKRRDPNKPLKGKTLDKKQQMEIRKRLEETGSSIVTNESSKENESTLSDDEEFEKILNAKSSHDWVIQEEEKDKQEMYFNSLEKKEQLEERLSQIKELTVRVAQCKECGYISESVGSRCHKEGHAITRLRATKRCFKCSGCGQRMYTYNERYPSQFCQCGGNKYQKCSIYKERSGPKLPSEELSLRGYEQKYLNSLK